MLAGAPAPPELGAVEGLTISAGRESGAAGPGASGSSAGLVMGAGELALIQNLGSGAVVPSQGPQVSPEGLLRRQVPSGLRVGVESGAGSASKRAGASLLALRCLSRHARKDTR